MHDAQKQALTCPDFKLDDLKDDVKRSVLAAALDSDDPCSSRNAIGGVKIEGEEQTASETVGDYYWTVTDNTFYAKKDGAPTTTDYDFYIKFEGAEPRVWVEDAEEWKEKTCSDISNYVTERGIDSYSNYNITLTMNGSECISDYGKAKYEKRMEQLTNPLNPAYLAWGVSCMGATAICAGTQGFLTAGMTAPDAVLEIGRGYLTCWAGPALAAASNWVAFKLFPTEQPGMSRTLPVLGITAAIGTDYIRYSRASKKLLELESAIGAKGDVVKYATDTLDGLLKTKPSDIVVGRTGIGDKTIDNLSRFKEMVSKIQEILKLGGRGDAADEIGKAIEAMDKACGSGSPGNCKDAVADVIESLKKQEGVIKEAAQEVQKEYEEVTKKSSKLGLCTTIGQIAGAVVGSIKFMAQYVPTDTLTINIGNVKPVGSISIGPHSINLFEGSNTQWNWVNVPNAEYGGP